MTTRERIKENLNYAKDKIKNIKIPEKINFDDIEGLSNESKQKLNLVKPKTLAHAQRIPGLTPAAISLLLVHIKKKNIQEINVV